jgi:uncharacterized protein YbaR (Trm112 family)
MHADLLAILRCPYCGGRLELVTSLFHRITVDTITDGVLGCECCTFPVVDGIAVLHLGSPVSAARERVEAGDTTAALMAMIGVQEPARMKQFAALAASPLATYKSIVDALGPEIEGGYFLYRFSDPTFVVADAVVRAVAGTVLGGGGRALDICGGSGHLTRALAAVSPAPVLADLFFAKIWLARRFTAPSAVPVCCDANAPLPFARGAFDFALCSDALMYIWQKRQLAGEMLRAVDGSPRGTVVINHTHNQLVWSPSHGQALTPAGYRGLFETAPPRIFGESTLFADIVRGTTLDLSHTAADEALNREVALTLIASPVADVFRTHPVETPRATSGEWRINPLFQVQDEGTRLRATLHFPSPEYEDEYRACREYLPDEVFVDVARFHALQAGAPAESMRELIRRRVIVELPRLYC